MSDSGSDDDASPQPQRTQHAAHEDEDEFEFEQNFTEKKGPLKKTLDKPFDEVHEVSDDSSSQLSPSTSPLGKHHAQAGQQHMQHMQQQQRQGQSFEESDEEEQSQSHNASMSESMSPQKKHGGKKDRKDSKSSGGAYAGKPGNVMAGKPGNMMSSAGSSAPQNADESSEEEESGSEEDEDASLDAGGAQAGQQGAARLYNPAEFKHLVVSSEISGLFEYITRHKAADIELDTKLKPFIPDYIPAVGEIDAFLKVPPPDPSIKLPALGLVVLDEPAAAQSDPTVLELSLRAVNKAVISSPHATVGTIEHADKNPARVLKWIQSIEDVHRKKPPPHVHYSRPMPDIEQLMQVWPSEFEQLLQHPEFQLPDVNDLDCDVAAFARMVCAIMDIPVYDKLTESLHVLFTLYSEFQNHAYFQH